VCGLKQAPRAWYGRLRGFLFERGVKMGKVDQILFLLRQGRDILIVQVYVDDIIFGGSSNSLVARFADDMSREFEINMMGELQFFIGLQIKQSKEGTFVHQAKYTKDIVRKFKMEDSKAMVMPMSTTTALNADEEGEHVDQKEYRSMIESLLYFTATRQTYSSQYVYALVFKRLQGLRIDRHSSVYSGTCVTLPTSAFGTPRLIPWRFMVFQKRILPGVSWIRSPLLGLASSWDILWCLGLLANSRVLLNPLPMQSTLLQLAVALSSFRSHTP
jgi:hypothetical protein